MIHNEQVWAENRFTAERQLLHKKANEGPDEHRASGSILRALHVSSEKLGITGICDIVEIQNLKSQISNLKSQISNHIKYERFEDLPAWQDAILLAEGCEDFLIVTKKHITTTSKVCSSSELLREPQALAPFSNATISSLTSPETTENKVRRNKAGNPCGNLPRIPRCGGGGIETGIPIPAFDPHDEWFD